MGLIGTMITLAVVTLLGTINVYEALALGIIIFAISLIISRYFDKAVMKVTKSIVLFLASHEKTRSFVLEHF
jgi:hypothetical protein